MMLSLKDRAPEEITQYLRGEHYFYLDFLMSQAYGEVDDLRCAYAYFSQNIKFVKSYLEEMLKKGIHEWTRGKEE